MFSHLSHVVRNAFCIFICHQPDEYKGEVEVKIKWDDLDEAEKRDLIEQEVLGYKVDSLDDSCIYKILDSFNTYQVTKLFPLKYKTIIEANKYVATADTLIDSVCMAALKRIGIID